MSYSKSNAHAMSFKEIIARGRIVENKQFVKAIPTPKSTRVEYPVFDLAKEGADISAKELTNGLLELKKKNRKGDYVDVVSPQKSIILPYAKTTWKYSHPDIRCVADKAMYSRLVNAGLGEYAKASVEMFRSNGTRRGLLNRMKQQLTIKLNPPTPDEVIYEMAQRLRVNAIKDDEFLKILSSEDACFEKLNTKASAGLPYAFVSGKNGEIPKLGGFTTLSLEYRHHTNPVPLMDEPMLVIEHAFYWARKIWKIVDDAEDLPAAFSSLGDFFDTYPEFRTFMLKRKEEKMDRNDYKLKVRPYGCQSLPARMFCMWAVSLLEQNLLSFFEDQRSLSSYHFSQFYGGAERIINHFESFYRTSKERFTGIAYGDDQLWSIRLDNGTIAFLTPDIKAMDMNTQSDTISVIGKWIKLSIPNIPELNFKALIVALSMAFNHHVHVDGPYVIGKTQSMFSGVPGTTLWNY
jgi:hypothetical protein